MASSLKTKTIGALIWSFVQEISQRGLQMVVSLLLARMLGPKEYGLIAMLSIFMAVSQALVNGGFGSALVQKKTATPLDESSVFYFNIVLGFFMAGVLSLAAPWIAEFYDQPQLTNLARAVSVVLIINSFITVQSARLTKKLDFRRQALINVVSESGAGGIGVGMAYSGFGVWSLVAQQITSSLIRASMYWVTSSWRPMRAFSMSALRSMFRFGSGMVGSSLLNSLFDNLYSLVIGKMFSATALGYYNRAATFQSMVSHSLGNVVNRVTFPLFAQIQDDRLRLKSALQRAIRLTTFVQFPLMLGLAAIAEPLVLVLLTEKWSASIPFLQWLCFSGMLYPLHLLNLNVLMGLGHSGLFFRLQLLKKVMIIINILVSAKWGIMTLVYGMVVNGVINYFINSYYTSKFVGYSSLQQLRDVLPALASSAVMALSVKFIHLPMPMDNYLQLGFKIILGLLIYMAISHLFRLSGLHDAIDLVHSKVPLPRWVRAVGTINSIR